MSLIAPHTDYTDKDFDALRARLIQLLRSVFPDWTDFDVAGFGTILMEMFAFVGDTLTFYQDNLARESRLVTATQRKNVMALAGMLGYRLHGKEAATAELTFSLLAPQSARVVIPKGTTVRTQEVTEPVRFQTLQDAVIEAQADPPTITVIAEHSESHRQLVEAQGQRGFEMTLDRTPYLDGSAQVETPTGSFTEVRTFLDSGPNDLHFTVQVDQNDRATLRFGDGKNALPPEGTITVTYKTGGGPEGNVDRETLILLEGSFSDDHGRPVQCNVTNTEPASGGTARESIERAKLMAPESLRAMTRSVAREDFEINARRLPQVARALMMTSNEDPRLEENTGVLYVVPRGGGAPTPALKNLVLRQVTEVYPCTLTFQVSVLDPVYRRVDVSARVFLRPGANRDAARQAIRQALARLFDVENPSVDFGFNLKDAGGQAVSEVAWSDVFNAVRDVPAVRKVGSGTADFLLNGASNDVSLRPYEFPILGTVTLLDGDSGGLL